MSETEQSHEVRTARALPTVDSEAASGGEDEESPTSVLVRVDKVSRVYRTQASFFRRETVRAVQSVDLKVFEHEILALLGQSGSGKSTLGRILVRLVRPTSGTVWFKDIDITRLRGRTLLLYRKRVGIVFQDPYSSLNPRLKVGAALAEPLRVWNIVPKGEVGSEVERLLESVAIPLRYIDRYPHALSGGERQRVAIARAIATRPEFLVADEAVSALDVGSAAEILNLLLDLHSQLGLTVLFATHDIGAARVIADRVAVMQLGRIVELGPAREVLSEPRHEYTKRLIGAELHLPDAKQSQA